jgi:hypothetical protein
LYNNIDDVLRDRYVGFYGERERLGYDSLFLKDFSNKGHIDINTDIIRERGWSTVLDYGCGKSGSVYHHELDIFLYDCYDKNDNDFANIKTLSELKYYDCVIFSHVLEHMEEQEMIESLQRIRDHTNYVIIGLPNHTNFFNRLKSDITHKQELVTGFDFYIILESLGYTIERIIFHKHLPEKNFKMMARILFNFIMGYSIFYEVIIIAKTKTKK